MSFLNDILERNRQFAAEMVAGSSLMPSLADAVPGLKATVIACADMRVDPASVLGLQPGEALVLRNIGGRVTPVLLEELAALGRIGKVLGRVPGDGGEFHLIVLQHTDCGITSLHGDPALLAHLFQIVPEALAAKHILDPRAAVTADVASLRAVPALPAGWILSGLVYDVATGLVEVVVDAAPLRS